MILPNYSIPHRNNFHTTQFLKYASNANHRKKLAKWSIFEIKIQTKNHKTFFSFFFLNITLFRINYILLLWRWRSSLKSYLSCLYFNCFLPFYTKSKNEFSWKSSSLKRIKKKKRPKWLLATEHAGIWNNYKITAGIFLFLLNLYLQTLD